MTTTRKTPPACVACGKPATHYEAGDMECGEIHNYEPCCDQDAYRADYRYCLNCYGHIDGNESSVPRDGCFKCGCGGGTAERCR